MKRKFKKHDHPFDECCAGAERVIAGGGTVFQKWWCTKCGARCRANTPNYFTKLCVCEDCGTITDVVEHGCNYVAIMTIWPGGAKR